MQNIIDPWIVGCNFNFILDSSEKWGGLLVNYNGTTDVNQCVNTCSLTNLEYSESNYTWWNKRTEEECILKRLHRVFENQKFVNEFSSSEVRHLIT